MEELTLRELEMYKQYSWLLVLLRTSKREEEKEHFNTVLKQFMENNIDLHNAFNKLKGV